MFHTEARQGGLSRFLVFRVLVKNPRTKCFLFACCIRHQAYNGSLYSEDEKHCITFQAQRKTSGAPHPATKRETSNVSKTAQASILPIGNFLL